MCRRKEFDECSPLLPISLWHSLLTACYSPSFVLQYPSIPTVIWSRCMSSCTVAASVPVTEQPELPEMQYLRRSVHTNTNNFAMGL